MDNPICLREYADALAAHEASELERLRDALDARDREVFDLRNRLDAAILARAELRHQRRVARTWAAWGWAVAALGVLGWAL